MGHFVVPPEGSYILILCIDVLVAEFTGCSCLPSLTAWLLQLLSFLNWAVERNNIRISVPDTNQNVKLYNSIILKIFIKCKTSYKFGTSASCLWQYGCQLSIREGSMAWDSLLWCSSTLTGRNVQPIFPASCAGTGSSWDSPFSFQANNITHGRIVLGTQYEHKQNRLQFL